MSNRNYRADGEDRLKFLVALMTKDYKNVMTIGSAVLRRNPSDVVIMKTLSAVKDKIAVNSLAESADDDSDEDTTDEENMQTDCDTSSDPNSDMDDDDEETESEDDDRITIDANKYCQSSVDVPAKNLSDCIKNYLRSRMEKGAMVDYGFKEKIHRILVLKTRTGLLESIART